MHAPRIGIAPPGIYEKILQDLGPLHGIKVLDTPCGNGGFAHAMAEEGAVCMGMDRERPTEHSRAIIGNMNDSFPILDGAFDAITCVEGLEHMYSPFHVLKEFFRLLRPGGRLFLTTPNIHNVRSRIKFLLRGTLFWFDPREVRGVGHIAVIPYFILRHMLNINGFTNITVGLNRSMGTPVPGFISTLMQRIISKRNFEDRELNSPILLNAECLMVMATKPKSPGIPT